MTELRQRIQDVIKNEPVAVFMKGTPQFVMCGNSDRALRALREAGAPVAGIDVLADPAIRQELSEISGWPTIPQIFVKGELIGGADIVAEMYQSMSEDRAWRPALGPEEATRQLRDEVAARRLDGRALEAVLLAAGQPRAPGRSGHGWPAGLTDREVDVLRAITRGLANKQIARDLHISEATVHTHVINVYGKIGVNTRAGATLFAFENDLVGKP